MAVRTRSNTLLARIQVAIFAEHAGIARLPVLALSAIAVLASLSGCGQDAKARSGLARTGTIAQASTATPVPAGAVEYVYDGAGNMTEARAVSAGGPSLTITDFQPQTGSFGQVVTVSGVGFDPNPQRNQVTLGGITVTALASTDSTLTFVVPDGASTGRIWVATATESVASATDFTVTSQVILADFTPKIGRGGTVLTITGSTFDPDPSGDQVLIGGSDASVTAATSTTLTAIAGTSVRSGTVSVITRWGHATSTADFIVVPGGIAEADLAFTGRIPAGASATMSSAAGKKGLFLFEGQQGRGSTLLATANTYAGTTSITVYAPSGGAVFSGSLTVAADTKLRLGVLPETGTYTVAVTPAATSTGQLTLQAFQDAVTNVEVDGPAASFSLARGQNGQFLFAGAPGDLLSLAIPVLAATPAGTAVTFTVFAPDGTSLYSFTWSSASTITMLPITLLTKGIYRIEAAPAGPTPASITLLLSRPITGALVADSSTVRYASDRAAQIGQYTFSGAAGALVTMHLTAGSTFTGKVWVYQPTGALLTTSSWMTPNASTKFEVGWLPVAGTYRVEVVPSGFSTGWLDMRLIPYDRARLALDAPPQTLTLATAQNGRYVFDAKQGDVISMAVTSFATIPSSTVVLYTFYKPDGTVLRSIGRNAAGVDSKLADAMPQTGTYALDVAPYWPTSASLSVVLSRSITGTMPTDGTTLRFATTTPGQLGQYSFSGAAGDAWTMYLMPGTPPPSSVYVFQPSGASIATASGFAANSGRTLNLGVLPVSGTYRVEVNSGLAGSTVDLRLVPYALGAVAIDAAPASLTLETAQNGRYTFFGNAGDVVSFALTSLATTPAGAGITFTVYQPSGASIWSASYGGPASAPKIGSSLPATGTYALEVVPNQTLSGASLTVLMSTAITGTLATDGTPTEFSSTRPGQQGRYTFTGNGGDRWTLKAVSGGGLYAAIIAYQSSGASVGSATFDGTTEGKADLAPLPASGTYRVELTPYGVSTGSATLQLIPYALGTLTPGAAPTVVTLTSGQNGWYTYTASAGDVLSLSTSAFATTPAGRAVQFMIFKPDGSFLSYANVASSTTMSLGSMPVSGTYGLRISPPGTAAMSAGVQLTKL